LTTTGLPQKDKEKNSSKKMTKARLGLMLQNNVTKCFLVYPTMWTPVSWLDGH